MRVTGLVAYVARAGGGRGLTGLGDGGNVSYLATWMVVEIMSTF